MKLTYGHRIAAEVVLADCSIVEVNDTQYSEPLWASRSGSGNFGIVTRFTLRLRPVGPVHHYACNLFTGHCRRSLDRVPRVPDLRS